MWNKRNWNDRKIAGLEMRKIGRKNTKNNLILNLICKMFFARGKVSRVCKFVGFSDRIPSRAKSDISTECPEIGNRAGREEEKSDAVKTYGRKTDERASSKRFRKPKES
jgi:hypothetical protein